MQPKRQPDANPKPVWQPPKGLIFYHRPERPAMPFAMQWRDGFGQRHTLTFNSVTARETAGKALAAKLEQHGREILTFDPVEWRRWLEFRRIVGEADLAEIAHDWKERQAAKAAADLPVAEAAERYLKAREKDGIARATLVHARMDMRRLAEAFGAKLVGELSADDVRAWLASLPFSEVTKRNHYKRGSAFFQWMKLNEWVKANPFDAVQSPARIAEEVGILTVEETAKLFSTMEQIRPELCARLALEAFAGLRYSSAARLAREEINFVDRGITLPAVKLKTRKRHYIDGLPDNLWAWLEAAPDAAWSLTERNYLLWKSEAFRLADIPHPRNCLRHSFCSYHVALGKDAARTAVILCHASPSMLYQHYKGRATSIDGARYFGIRPEPAA